MAIKINPNFPKAYFYKGKSLFHLNKYKMSIDQFDLAMKYDNMFVDAFYYNG